MVTHGTHRRTCEFFSSAASTMEGSSPALPPTNTASGTGSFASASGATPGTACTLPHPNASAFSRMSRTPVALRSTAHTDPARATSAASIDTLPVPAPTSHTVSVAVRRSFASATARTSCLVMGTSPRMKSSSGMPEEAYGQRELAARDAPAESTTEEVAAGADAPAGASEAALEPAGDPAPPAKSISITFKSSNV